MEKMKYLFLDMEWSQENDFDVKENQILEFAVASYSNDFESQRRFARMVKPTDVYAIPECQTAHCGRYIPHFDFGAKPSPIVPYRHLPQSLSGMTADCRSLV